MKAALLISLSIGAVAFSSCNTMIGFGRDMRIGGEGLERSASKINNGGDSEQADPSGAPVY